MQPATITFRPLTREDFPLLARWLAEPPVARWWHQETSPEAVERDFGPSVDGADVTELFRVALASRPIGLVPALPDRRLPGVPRGVRVTAAGTADPARDQIDWNPEWSRRGRGVAVYAAIRSLGRERIQEMIERCSDHAHHLVTELGALRGVELLAEPQINQGLVRFLARDGDHDRRTDEVIARAQTSGEAWFGGTTWNDKRAMRVSVINWQTNDNDVDRAAAAVRGALTHDPGTV